MNQSINKEKDKMRICWSIRMVGYLAGQFWGLSIKYVCNWRGEIIQNAYNCVQGKEGFHSLSTYALKPSFFMFLAACLSYT